MNLVDAYVNNYYYVIVRNLDHRTFSMYGYTINPGEAIVAEEGAARTMLSSIKAKFSITPYYNQQDETIRKAFLAKHNLKTDMDARYDKAWEGWKQE